MLGHGCVQGAFQSPPRVDDPEELAANRVYDTHHLQPIDADSKDDEHHDDHEQEPTSLDPLPHDLVDHNNKQNHDKHHVVGAEKKFNAELRHLCAQEHPDAHSDAEGDEKVPRVDIGQ